MQSLPEQDYEYAEWRFVRVGIDYHVEVEGFFYSVPHALLREQVDTRITTRTIEIFHRGKRVASHARRYGGPRHGTLPDHMPSLSRSVCEAALGGAERGCAPALCRMVGGAVCSPGP
jgi:transposase